MADLEGRALYEHAHSLSDEERVKFLAPLSPERLMDYQKEAFKVRMTDPQDLEPAESRADERPAAASEPRRPESGDEGRPSIRGEPQPARARSIQGAPAVASVQGPENEMLPGAFLIWGERRRRTIARLISSGKSGSPGGTGFLVSPSLLMTCHHVLPTRGIAESVYAQFDFVPDEPGVHAQRHRLDPAKFYYSDIDLDFALVSVEPVAQEQGRLAGRGWSPLPEERPASGTSERVNIIQHPHGGSQKVALRENQEVRVPRAAPIYLHYKTDTLLYSSGSPLFCDRWTLIGLHHSSWDEVSVNEGVWIDAIAARLRSVQRGELKLDPKEYTWDSASIEECFEPPAYGRPGHGPIPPIDRDPLRPAPPLGDPHGPARPKPASVDAAAARAAMGSWAALDGRSS